MFIYNMFILCSAIMFVLAVYKLKESSIKIGNLLSFKIPNEFKIIINSKVKNDDKKMIGVVLGVHLLGYITEKFIFFLVLIIPKTNELLGLLGLFILFMLLIFVMYLSVFYLWVMFFSLYVFMKKTINIKRSYILYKITGDNLCDFMNKNMSYNTVSRVEKIIETKYFDEPICDQLILLDNLCDDDAFRKSKSKEIVDFVKSIDGLILTIHQDYLKNKENNLKEREQALIKDYGSALSDIAKSNNYLKDVLK